MIVLQAIGPAKPLAEHGQIALGQEADGDHRIEVRLGNWLVS